MLNDYQQVLWHEIVLWHDCTQQEYYDITVNNTNIMAWQYTTWTEQDSTRLYNDCTKKIDSTKNSMTWQHITKEMHDSAQKEQAITIYNKSLSW